MCASQLLDLRSHLHTRQIDVNMSHFKYYGTTECLTIPYIVTHSLKWFAVPIIASVHALLGSQGSQWRALRTLQLQLQTDAA
jgi:hypothetical protein